MIKTLKIIVMFSLSISLTGNAQTSLLWGNLHCPVAYYPEHLYYDTTQNVLYMSGRDQNMYETISKFDGTTWTTLPITGCSNNFNFINYNGDLLLGSTTVCSPSILKWNGTNWVAFDSILPDYTAYCFLEHNNELYVGGTFNSIGNGSIVCYGVAKFNGTTWSSVGVFPFDAQGGDPNTITSLCYYNGEIYAGGNFSDNAGNVMNIARWDGTNWNDVGGGMHGGMDAISDMIVYNNELYVAGLFKQADGNAGNYIQKWNGTNWSDVGGGVMGPGGSNGQIFDIEIFNNALYACGDFVTAGGIPVTHIAKWDGTNWCSIGDEVQGVSCLTKSNTDLYVGNFYKIIDGDTTGSIVKWIGGNYVDSCTTTGVEELGKEDGVGVYPNPTTGIFTINSDATKIKSIRIENILGVEIKNLNTTTVDLTDIPNGIYFAEIKTERGIINKKIIKQ